MIQRKTMPVSSSGRGTSPLTNRFTEAEAAHARARAPTTQNNDSDDDIGPQTPIPVGGAAMIPEAAENFRAAHEHQQTRQQQAQQERSRFENQQARQAGSGSQAQAPDTTSGAQEKKDSKSPPTD
jgi:hypothetical protein